MRGASNRNRLTCCDRDASTDSPAKWTGLTRHAPSGFPTIQAAVDAADSVDMVLID
jgi:hypothetical protein